MQLLVLARAGDSMMEKSMTRRRFYWRKTRRVEHKYLWLAACPGNETSGDKLIGCLKAVGKHGVDVERISVISRIGGVFKELTIIKMHCPQIEG